MVRRARTGCGNRRRESGGALVEFTVVVLFLLIVLLANPDVIHELADELRKAYTSFVYALSVSWV